MENHWSKTKADLSDIELEHIQRGIEEEKMLLDKFITECESPECIRVSRCKRGIDIRLNRDLEKKLFLLVKGAQFLSDEDYIYLLSKRGPLWSFYADRLSFNLRIKESAAC
jgi:hypothetical protein